MVLKVCLHEWLSDGVSLCQDEGRGFECLRSAPVVAGERPPDVLQRLVLSIRCEKEEMSDGYLLFFLCSSPAGLERFECLRAAPVVAVERLILALMK